MTLNSLVDKLPYFRVLNVLVPVKILFKIKALQRYFKDFKRLMKRPNKDQTRPFYEIL